MPIFSLFLFSLPSFSRISNAGKQLLAVAVTYFIVWLHKKMKLVPIQYIYVPPTPMPFTFNSLSGLSKGAERYGELGSRFLYSLWVEADERGEKTSHCLKHLTCHCRLSHIVCHLGRICGK